MPTVIEKFDQIASEMEALTVGNGRDIEADHARADELLIEALQWASALAKLREPSERMVAAYRSISKWYA
jgi:uncharacterized protein (DUF1800 family)